MVLTPFWSLTGGFLSFFFVILMKVKGYGRVKDGGHGHERSVCVSNEPKKRRRARHVVCSKSFLEKKEKKKRERKKGARNSKPLFPSCSLPSFSSAILSFNLDSSLCTDRMFKKKVSLSLLSPRRCLYVTN